MSVTLYVNESVTKHNKTYSNTNITTATHELEKVTATHVYNRREKTVTNSALHTTLNNNKKVMLNRITLLVAILDDNIKLDTASITINISSPNNNDVTII